ncbi:unnamed protein product, partial [Urochloa humidicola]
SRSLSLSPHAVLFAPYALGLGRSGGGAAAAARLAAWGAGFRVAFVGGTIMFRNLLRHQFGSLQGKMFLAYFTLMSVLFSDICGSICIPAPLEDSSDHRALPAWIPSYGPWL